MIVLTSICFLLAEMGNQKANEYWEADLPGNFKRPNEQDRPAVESFIRAK